MMIRLQLLIVAGLLALVSNVQAADAVPEVSPERVRAAIQRTIPLLERGAVESARQRECFTCHNQALPVLALTEAASQGLAIDAAVLEQQLAHTDAHLKRGRQSYLDGKGQGGKAVTAGYALWALEAGARKPDETTDAVVGYLLGSQSDQKYWSHPGNRPPSSGSNFTTTYVALRGLAVFGRESQQVETGKRREAVREWLLNTPPRDTEDRVFRLLSLPYVAAGEDVVAEAVRELVADQREDGGWAQNSEMASDAYATATVLSALFETGDATSSSDSTRRGIGWLIERQQEDGSWHVTTRAKPFQTYYESGFPHGKDQFISIAASAWATVALSRSLGNLSP